MDATTAAMVDYSRSVSYEDLSQSSIDACKVRVLDSLGCIAAAYDHPVSVSARTLARSYTTPELGATVLGSNRKVAPEMAAFANGVMLRLLDISDMYRVKSGGHPSDVIAAVLAAAELANASGEELISAIVLAYEIYCGCCDSIDLNSKGWDQPVYGVVAGAMAAGRLLKLDRAQMGNALSLALVPNMALYQTRHGELSSWKGCAAANASRNALFAVLLARAGFTGPSAAFEGRGGLWDVVGKFDWAGALDHGSSPSRITKTHLKCFPVCYHGQSAVWAALGLRDQVPLTDIKTLRIETYGQAINIMASDASRWNPATHETADHSLPYVVTTALRDGNVNYESFSAERLQDPALLQFMGTVTVHDDQAFSADYPSSAACRVIATRKDGKQVSHEVIYPKGHDKNPLDKSEIDGKFVSLFKGFSTPKRGRDVINLVSRLEQLTTLDDLFVTFRQRSKARRIGTGPTD